MDDEQPGEGALEARIARLIRRMKNYNKKKKEKSLHLQTSKAP